MLKERIDMLNWLKEHIKNTPIESIRKEWSKIEQDFPSGVNAMDYIGFTKAVYKTKYAPSSSGIVDEKINFSNNMTSNFSGSFFFRNIAE